MLNNGGFFGLENSGGKIGNFFTDTDVSTILGKNLVKNYVGKIGFELGLMGFSETANEIAEYYEECKLNTSIIEFMQNAVIKMILQEVKENKRTEIYLNERIFNEVYNEYTKKLNDYFLQSQKLYNETKVQEKKFLKSKIELENKIQELVKTKNMTEDEARNYLETSKKVNKLKDLMKLPDFSQFLNEPLTMTSTNLLLNDISNLPNVTGTNNQNNQNNNKGKRKSSNNNSTTIKLDDDFSFYNDDENDDLNNFFD